MKKFVLLTIGLLVPFLSAQAQYFTNGNLVVSRINGYDTTTGDGASVFIDQYTTGGTLLNSFAVPNSGGNSLLVNGEPYEGLLTLTPDGNHVVFAGYNSGLNVQELLSSTSSTVHRVIATLDAYGNYTLAITNSTNYNDSSINNATSDGTNFWMSGTGPANTGYNQVIYAGTATAGATNQLTTNLFGSGLRSVNIYNVQGTNELIACGYVSNSLSSTEYGTGGFVLSNISGALPTTATGATNIFYDGSSPTASDIVINPAGTIAYMADQSIGIVKFTNTGNGWGSNYTVLTTNAGYTIAASGHAISVTADWSQNPPVVYATTDETATNRLVKFVDNGPFPTIINLATNLSGNPTNAFRGVRFAPYAYGYVSVPPVGYTGAPGATATFSASVLGSPAPTLQWYSNSVANPAYVAIPGATNATLSLPNITSSQNGSLFYLVASNTYGSSTSPPVALTIENPAITSEPVGATNFPGSSSVSLCVTAVGTGTLTYQWLSNGITLGASAQSACYTPPVSAVSNTALYTVIVSNSLNESITSSPAIVSYSPYLVYDTFSYPNGVLFGDAGSPWTEESGSEPIYVTNGRVQISQTIGALGTAFGQDLYFQPVAQGSTVMWASFTLNLSTLPATPSGTYLAYFQSTNFNFYGRIIALTSNNPAYTPNIPAVAGPGTYRLGIANDATAASAVVELDMAPGIDYQVVAYYDMVNQFCQLAVNPSQAEYNQVYSPLVDQPSPLVSGVTVDSFTAAALPMAAYGLRQAADVGIMQLDNLEVSDDWNGPGSGYAAVTAGVTPTKAVIGLVTPGVTNYAGNSNVLEVAASGIDLTYAWYQNGAPLSDGNSLIGSATPTLAISPEVGTNSGSYTVVVSNEAGSVTSAVVVVSINTTPTPPSFTLEPVSVTASLGASVTFTASAVGTGPITYAWNTDGTPNGATGPSFTVTRVATNMSGNTYSVTASGGAAPSTTSTNAVLTVLGPVVTNIAYLRSLLITNAAPTITVAASNSTTVYQVTGTVMIYTNVESSAYSEYWIQDATAGIEFFVIDPTFRPHLGDLITASGVVDIFDDALELDGSANNPSEPYNVISTNGEGLPLPYPNELIPFGFATANEGLSAVKYQGSRGTFTNVYFTTPGAVIAGDSTLEVTNNSGQIYYLYISQSAGPDLAGQIIPAFAYSVSGAYDQFDAEYELNLTAGTDIVTAAPPRVTNVAGSYSGGNITLNWTAVPASYTYSVWSTTNLLVPFAPIAPGLWFNTSNGTYTGAAGAGSRYYEIVSP